MAIQKKSKLRKWIIRILLFILLLPIGTLSIVRTAGLFKMRKTDSEIISYLKQRSVTGELDTLLCKGRKISYLTTTNGNKHKDAILFVHGSPGSMDAYLDYVTDTSLLAQADLITYDRPGLGHSQYGKALPSLTGQTEITGALMSKLGYERYWLVGHSYGGPIIVQSAMMYPKLVAGICVVAGSVSPELEPKAGWRKWIDLPLVRELFPPSMRVSNEELMPLKQDLKMIEDDWSKIRIPVSLIHGSKDVLVPFANMAYAKEKLVNAKVIHEKVFDGENHFILWTEIPIIISELHKLIDGDQQVAKK